MPQLGLGTWPMDDAEAADAVAGDCASGSPHHTAENYKNERGSARASAIPALTARRCSSPPNSTESGTASRVPARPARRAWAASGWTISIRCWCTGHNPDQDRDVEAFAGRALCPVWPGGAIGRSKFKPPHLQRLFDQGLTPHVNQIQLDPYHLRSDLVAIHRARVSRRKLEPARAWQSDAGRQHHHRGSRPPWPRTGTGGAALAHPAGLVPTPKSADPGRQMENLDSFGFTLSDEEMVALG